MDFKYYIKTKVIFGNNCISNNSDLLSIGNRAIIVTGKKSATISGALSDVIEILNSHNIKYAIFDEVENNPSLETVKRGGVFASNFAADFIIGIGGGSPLDAAKAVAVLAVNDIEPLKLFENKFLVSPLPIVTIPTAAGTGSEVTPYSILTRDDIKTKMSFGNEDTFPLYAFIDSKYTDSVPLETTVYMAVDALSHAIEGYLCKRSSCMSDLFAKEAITIFSNIIAELLSGEVDADVRKKLSYLSLIGGMVITHTGTTIAHGMGYSLTYFNNLPHGLANGILLKEYLEYNYKFAKSKIDCILDLLRMSDFVKFGRLMEDLLKFDKFSVHLSKEDIEKYADLTMKQRSTANNARNVLYEDVVALYYKVFFKDILF